MLGIGCGCSDSKLPNVPASIANNHMIEYAKSLLMAVFDLDMVITSDIQEKMNYLQKTLEDIEARAIVCIAPNARYEKAFINQQLKGY